ncbi:hypothetical protein RUM44_002638 [Polyplax serrata]|uniref:Uncharacterized protein n=1 Tax=Polyplax serrata TaxID=468196 RepID=A0ABR1AFC2_POLSC
MTKWGKSVIRRAVEHHKRRSTRKRWKAPKVWVVRAYALCRMFDKIKWARGVDDLRKIQDQCRPVVASHGSSRWLPVNYIWADTSCKAKSQRGVSPQSLPLKAHAHKLVWKSPHSGRTVTKTMSHLLVPSWHVVP